MKKIISVAIILLIVFIVYWFFFSAKSSNNGPKQEALKAGRHSDGFNKSIDTLLQSYFGIKSSLVEADTAKAKGACRILVALSDSSKLEELKKDTSGIFASAAMQLSDVKVNAESLLRQTDITEIRKDFQMISESIYPLLKTIHYEGATLYWQNCPMAFGEGKEANWISNTEEIVNPYLGKNHPEYKGSMLHCGEVKDSIKAQ